MRNAKNKPRKPIQAFSNVNRFIFLTGQWTRNTIRKIVFACHRIRLAQRIHMIEWEFPIHESACLAHI